MKVFQGLEKSPDKLCLFGGWQILLISETECLKQLFKASNLFLIDSFQKSCQVVTHSGKKQNTGTKAIILGILEKQIWRLTNIKIN